MRTALFWFITYCEIRFSR